MLVAAAVCPCPPLLVPEVAQSAAPELREVREACAAAVAVLADRQPERLVVVGPAAVGHRPVVEDAAHLTAPRACAAPVHHPEGSTGSFREFGVPFDVTLGSPAPGQPPANPPAPGSRLPYPLAVAAWLLTDVGWHGSPVEGVTLPASLSPSSCLDAGRRLAESQERTALLVMGDGSARRGPRAPGYLDDRAEAFDQGVSTALSEADLSALAAIDPVLAEELLAEGRPAWQFLTGAATGAGLRGTVHGETAPYGVAYRVVSWS